MEKKKILILGAGFGGLQTALNLANSKVPIAKITVISRDDFHEYHPDLYEVAAVFLPEKTKKRDQKLMFENLSGTVAIPLKDIFQNKPVELVTAEINSIDVKTKTVKTSKEDYSYDILVIALGSTTNYFNIPGLAEKSLPLKTVNDALNIRNTIDELFWQKKPGEEINIVVGGGGFTGCELVGQLASFTFDLAASRGHQKKNIHVSVIEAAPNLLGGGDPWLQEEAEKRLTKLGVKVHLNSKITGIGDHVVSLDGGDEHGFDVLIWTAGIRVNDTVAKLENVDHEKNLALVINPDLRLPNHEDIFAIGDNSMCWNSDHSKPFPATAQLAGDQGIFTAKNIIKLLAGSQLGAFQPEHPSFVVPLGKGFALAIAYGVHFEGILAWWLKRIVSLKYLLTILTPVKALKVWYSGVRFFLD